MHSEWKSKNLDFPKISTFTHEQKIRNMNDTYEARESKPVLGVHRVCTGRAQGGHRGAQGVHRVMCHREVEFFSSGDRSNRNFIRVCNTFTTADQPRGLVSPGTGRAVVIHWPTVHLLQPASPDTLADNARIMPG